MISGIAHVCLNVKDLKRSIAYYTKLGFKPKFEFTRDGFLYGAYLQVGKNNFIEMFENKDMVVPAQNMGLAHFCFETEDLDALIEMLKKENVKFTPKKKGCDNTWQIWLTDPDGNSFEVHQYTNESLQLKGGIVEADW